MNEQDNVTQSLAHTRWNCKYHIVFAPKYRRKVFYEGKREGIREILRTLCKWKGVEIIEGEICPDHVHMLDKAFIKYKHLEGLKLHSDQGWQYQMQNYHKSLKDRGVIPSMSRKGNCLDNSPMENFFGKMKNEMFYGFEYTFNSLDELQKAMEDYIDYHNNQRITKKLKGLTPVQYRNQSLCVNL